MTNYIVHTTVEKIEEKILLWSVNKVGDEVHKNVGWFVLFRGSSEFLFLGNEKPNLKVGQRCILRIEPLDT